ncbi:MAG: Asp-tRNA(Asn)/Glu-tRNA(Gln) amidotransferase subunit GatA [Thaumarchaeota archaeon]|nr:Asp-tRNA(Asn)/Glu-tRNA(Gln) amidotransferase subunit GatA [Nitrososphaerota archaeon]
MNEKQLYSTTISELSVQIRQGEVTSLEVTELILDRISRIDRKLNSYITVTHEEALRSAKQADRTIRSGKYLGPLHGIPIALKDLFSTRGIKTTCGSKILADHVPNRDATVVSKLKKAGAVLLGKLNMHEFAYGTTGDSSYFGSTRNPWDTSRITGGSSGGSGVAVAAGLCMAALGSDSGGSIRIPAALCGIVGLKPTYGRVSRYGVSPLSWSLDHVGPMTKSVRDAALMLQAIAGPDVNDASSSEIAVPDYAKKLSRGIKGMRIGCPKEHFFEALDDEVETHVRGAADQFSVLGAEVFEVSAPKFRFLRAAASTILASEASSYHEQYLRARAADYQEDVRKRLQTGRYILASHYLRAQRLRSLLIQETLVAFKSFDLLLAPTVPVTAPRIGESVIEAGGKKERVRGAMARFTTAFNYLGFPAISLPCGYASSGLPIGLQLVGRPFDEETVLTAANMYEENTAWHKKRPEI